jgi:hypothetical protein
MVHEPFQLGKSSKAPGGVETETRQWLEHHNPGVLGLLLRLDMDRDHGVLDRLAQGPLDPVADVVGAGV